MTSADSATRGELAPIDYDPGLVEESVRQAIDGGHAGVTALKLTRLRVDLERQLDRIYQMTPGEEREASFRRAFWRFFGEFGLDTWIPDCLDEFPRLRANLKRVLVQRPVSAGQEGAELWESQEQRGRGIPSYLVIILVPAQMRHPETLRPRLLPQLLQAEDRWVPEFGFQPGDLRQGTPAAQEQFRAIFDRLWKLSARVRLHDRGLLEGAGLREELETLGVEELLAPACDQTGHEQLLRLARRVSERTVVESAGPGGRCPLCRFPTTDWVSAETLPELSGPILADFEAWTTGDGCCGHCAEHYRMAVS